MVTTMPLRSGQSMSRMAVLGEGMGSSDQIICSCGDDEMWATRQVTNFIFESALDLGASLYSGHRRHGSGVLSLHSKSSVEKDKPRSGALIGSTLGTMVGRAFLCRRNSQTVGPARRLHPFGLERFLDPCSLDPNPAHAFLRLTLCRKGRLQRLSMRG